MNIKGKLKTAVTKVKETAVEYGADVISGAIIITMLGGFTYVVVKTVQNVRTFNNQPEVDWDNVVSDEEVQGMIDASNKWLDEKRSADKAEGEG